MRDAGRVVTREDLMADVWDENWFGSTKTLDVHIGFLRRKLGDDAARAALHPHGARRRVPLRGRGGRHVSLRARLLIALGYVVALVIVALRGAARAQPARPRRRRGPLAGARARPTCSPPAPAGSSRARDRDAARRLAASGRAPVRARVVVVGGTAGSWPTPPARRRSAPTTPTARSSRRRWAAALPGTRRSRHAGPRHPRHRGPGRSTPAGRRRGAAHAERRGGRPRRAPHAVGLAAVGAASCCSPRCSPRACSPARSRGRSSASARRRDTIASGDLDARAPVEGSREQRSLARSFNEMTERLARAAPRAGGVRRRRLAPAAHAADRPAAADRGGAREHGPERRRRHLDAGLDEVDRIVAHRSTTCSCSAAPASARAGRGGRPRRGRRRRPPPLGARRRRPRDRADASPTAPASVLRARAPTSTAPSTPCVENAIALHAARRPRRCVRAGGATIEVLDDGPGLAPGRGGRRCSAASTAGAAGRARRERDRPRPADRARARCAPGAATPRSPTGPRAAPARRSPRRALPALCRPPPTVVTMRERMLWVAIGVLSLLLAAALGLATSRLTEAPVGLTAEPVSADEALAPTATATPDAPRRPAHAEAEEEAQAEADRDPDRGPRPRCRPRSRRRRP